MSTKLGPKLSVKPVKEVFLVSDHLDNFCWFLLFLNNFKKKEVCSSKFVLVYFLCIFSHKFLDYGPILIGLFGLERVWLQDGLLNLILTWLCISKIHSRTLQKHIEDIKWVIVRFRVIPGESKFPTVAKSLVILDYKDIKRNSLTRNRTNMVIEVLWRSTVPYNLVAYNVATCGAVATQQPSYFIILPIISSSN